MLFTVRLCLEQLLIQLSRFILPIFFLVMGMQKAKNCERYFRELARTSRTNFHRRHIDMLARKGECSTSPEFFSDFKPKTHTVFIMGAGQSISKLTRSQWQQIEASDSFGCNFFIINDFIPDLYFIEGVQTQSRFDCFLTHAKKKEEAYSNTPWIVLYESWKRVGQPVDLLPENIQKQIYWNIPITIRSTSRKHIESKLNRWNKARRQGSKLLFAHAGSISLMLSAAVVAGYRDIVLCGVDLNSRLYFWEVDDKYKGLGPENVSGDTHETVDPKSHFRKHSITADEYIYLFERVVLKPEGITLSVSSSFSKLAETLPVYQFSESFH